jgi:hypothetical protein
VASKIHDVVPIVFPSPYGIEAVLGLVYLPRLAVLYVIASQCFTTGRIEAAVGYCDAGQIVVGRSRDAPPLTVETGRHASALDVVDQRCSADGTGAQSRCPSETWELR